MRDSSSVSSRLICFSSLSEISSSAKPTVPLISTSLASLTKSARQARSAFNGMLGQPLQLRTLENITGVALTRKDGRGIQLTAAGEVMVAVEVIKWNPVNNRISCFQMVYLLDNNLIDNG